MHVCLKKADKPCIVAFDEFQQISKYPEKNIEALLRSHIQHLSNVHFIFSGSERHLVTEMFLSSARPFYNSTSILELYPIVAEEYIPFVCHWFDVYERTIREEDVLVIYRLFEGNTYYMQKTFHEAFINTPIGSSCTLDILQQTDCLDAKQAAQYRETKSVDEVIAFHGIGRFRVHIYQNDGVPSACVKIINKKEGLPEELKALAGITQGLVLVCGKPHSGKSATLAALAEQMLAGRFMHLVTLESPVEYPIEAGKGLLSRRCIGKDTGSYKEGMDNLLHESADGVLIGELETPEAVQAALRAAKMGLVVLGTVNSVDADTAVERIAQLSGMEAPLQKTRVWKMTKAVIQQKYELCESTGKFVYNCEILKYNS